MIARPSEGPIAKGHCRSLRIPSYVKNIIYRLAVTFPSVVRLLITLSAKGYLTPHLWRPWLMNDIARAVWPTSRPWVGQMARLFNGMQLEVDPLDMIGKHIIRSGLYEPDTVEFIGRHLKQGMVFFDVGANIGQYTLIASQLVGPSGVVHAFEPHPELCDVLIRNVRQNNCTNVIVNNTAVGEADGIAKLFMSTSSNYGATSLAPSERSQNDGISVPVVSIDSYMKARRINHVDVAKLDIEGAELLALKGAASVLDRRRNLVLVVELCDQLAQRFGHSATDLVAHLKARRFRIFRPCEGSLAQYESNEADPPSFNVVAIRNGEDTA
jgi:FkbM family methyltransferase